MRRPLREWGEAVAKMRCSENETAVAKMRCGESEKAV